MYICTCIGFFCSRGASCEADVAPAIEQRRRIGVGFSIGWVDDWHQVRTLARRALDWHAWKEGAYLPHIALRCNGSRVAGLLASNGRVPLACGSTFCQLSLSDYFRGLHLAAGSPLPADVCSEAVFFPVRRFDESALQLPDGESLLSRLCSLL